MVIFFIPYHAIGGAERVHLEIAKSLDTKPIIFFDNIFKGQISSEFLETAYCFKLNSKLKKKILKFFLLFLNRFIKIILFGSNSVFFFELIAKLKSVKSIDLTHAFSTPEIWLERHSIKYIDFIDVRVVINQKTFNDFEDLYHSNGVEPIYLNRFRMINNGVQIFPLNHGFLSSRFDQFTIGWVGRNSPEKRLVLFIKIATETPFNVKIITDKYDSEYIQSENFKVVKGLNDFESVRNEFSEISVLLVTSSREGFPLVIMEAMELGIPVISTNVGGIKEHITHEKTGFLIEDRHDYEIIQDFHRVLQSLESNFDLYEKICLASRHYAEMYFELESFRANYRKLFDEE